MLAEGQRERNRKAIETLLPEARDIALMHLKLCSAEGIDLLVVQARRGMKEQADLYSLGRSAAGRPVTNARPGYSWHNFGRAYDVAVVEGWKIVWDSPKYSRAGAIGKSLGLVWGGDFKAVKGDMGHFEYHPGLTMAQARREAGIIT